MASEYALEVQFSVKSDGIRELVGLLVFFTVIQDDTTTYSGYTLQLHKGVKASGCLYIMYAGGVWEYQ